MVVNYEGLQTYILMAMREKIAKGQISIIADPDSPPEKPRIQRVDFHLPNGEVLSAMDPEDLTPARMAEIEARMRPSRDNDEAA